MAVDTITPPTLPTTGFVRLRQLLVFVPFGRSTVYRKIQQGQFPKPVRLSTNISAWRAEDIHAWIANAGETPCT